MVDNQLAGDARSTVSSSGPSSGKEDLLQKELDTGVKGLTCRRLLRLLSDSVLKYLDNYQVDCLPQLPTANLVDILALLASILEEHHHSLMEGAAESTSDSPHLQSQMKLDSSTKTTLSSVLKMLTSQLKAMLMKSKQSTEEKADPRENSSLSPLNFSLSPPTSASSVHLLFFVSQLIKQLQRLERIEQVEILNRRHDKPRARSEIDSREPTSDQSRNNSTLNGEDPLRYASLLRLMMDCGLTLMSSLPLRTSAAAASLARKSKRSTLVVGPASNNRRMFHLPVPQPLAVSRVLQCIASHLNDLAIPTYSFPASIATVDSSSTAFDLDAHVSVGELVDVVVRALSDKPIPGAVSAG